MHVKSLNLKNFRNYREQYIEFSPGTNIICGNNANGKTNILEAMYLFGYGKSHRAKSDSELINFGQEHSRITMQFEGRGREFTAVMNLDGNGHKAITMNNVPVKS